MLIDLQVHTTAGSPDSLIDPSELGAACREAGIDGVALTEHRACDYDAARGPLVSSGLVLVCAREVSCGGSHVLVFSEDEEMLSTLPPAVDAEDERLRSAVCVWAHPAAVGGSSAYGVLPVVFPNPEVLDGVEVLNGRHLHHEEAVTMAEDAADAFGCARTAGSDAHRVEDVGRCATRVAVDRGSGPEEIIEALRRGDVRPVLLRRWATRRGYDYRPSLRRYLG